jgi:MerR family mercuric resistance operon transcriptional regulator
MKARTIGMLAREAEVNVETIRFYERAGLLKKPPQPKNGWRVYGDEAVWTVRYIRLAQKMGFSLGNVRELGRRLWEGGNFCRDFRDTLEKKLTETDTEIARLTAIKSEIERTLASCQAKAGLGECPIVKHFPSRAVPRKSSR